MRIACVIIPHLSVQIARSRNPGFADRPLVIGGFPYEKRPVYDASPEAVAGGVKPGMPLREAVALCPESVFLPSDERLYQEAFNGVLAVLDNFSPVVEAEDVGCAYLDISGVPDENALAVEVIDRIHTSTSLRASVGISGGKFFSYTAALISPAGVAEIIPPGGERLFIAPFSTDILPCAEEVKESLRLIGVHTIGQASRFERDALGAQFGREGALLYDICRGIDDRLLTPRRRPQMVDVSTELEPPADGYLQLLHACRAILDRPLAGIREQGRACRALGVRLSFVSGSTLEKSLAFKEATVSIGSILNRLRAWLESEHFPAPVTAVELSLLLTREPGRNLALWHERRGGRELRSVARELKARLGFQPLKKVEVTDPNDILPERRFKLIEIDD